MTAYVILIREKLRDEGAMARYGEAAKAARGNHKITPLAFYGPHEVTEGADTEGVVILSFPSMAEAKAWYTSPEYTAAKAHRFQAADYRVIFVEGMG
ncbi:MAG: DUF1330 domain-containing protein [Hyphomonas sp.]|uniref:DUF1330 domain-containing protein n=1 Tax=Hyphomonas sp. TaxID=87 RepID=UPI0017CE9A03|nr:DUF1330 domain-containing protein [Hyphomonas sp.]MBA3069515.1 DUF1330 domain-containing protein [Hyphomonas sp.]MBU4063324.1 DUF1330 domain-containing protein [Alphaproteobacteria bacterium]MBU4164142.1 DUF1330 domain-containing protein [Alphaproteobacteria bacterium]MBU4569578.1 DUF1330 domain-containing protein [Alphaproteobacteria bacterium]